MKRDSWFPKRYADTVAKLRVPSGFLLVLAFAWLSSPTIGSLIWGLPVSVVGLLLRAWSAGHLNKNLRLATGGPYACTRNPLYLGTLIVAAGLVIASRQWTLAALFAGVFVFVYLPVIELEQQHLRSLFPGYAAYAARVPMLWPRIPPIPSEGSFQFAQYWKNQEYNALAGFLAGVALLVWKALR